MTRTVVITGGTGGIGRYTAIAMAKSGARVVITGRDRARGEAGLAAVREASGSADVHLALADLSLLADTRQLASEIIGRFGAIDVLVNNAGLLATARRLTDDGIEASLAVNVVAPYVLAHALAPAMKPGSRVINVTGGLPIGGLDTTNLQAERGFVALPSYSHSKRAMEAMSLELSRELGPRGVGVLIVYPGSAATAMTAAMTWRSVPWWMRPFWPLFRAMMREDGGRGAARASRSSVWTATDVALEGLTGRAFAPNCKPMKLHASVMDRANRAVVLERVRALASLQHP